MFAAGTGAVLLFEPLSVGLVEALAGEAGHAHELAGADVVGSCR